MRNREGKQLFTLDTRRMDTKRKTGITGKSSTDVSKDCTSIGKHDSLTMQPILSTGNPMKVDLIGAASAGPPPMAPSRVEAPRPPSLIDRIDLPKQTTTNT
jgi:hypothetical protein